MIIFSLASTGNQQTESTRTLKPKIPNQISLLGLSVALARSAKAFGYGGGLDLGVRGSGLTSCGYKSFRIVGFPT